MTPSQTTTDPKSPPGFAIAGRPVGPGCPPFIIAELSGNHNGDIDRAFRLIDAAAQAGADAVKLQTYTPDTITLDHDGPGFRLESGLWEGRTLYDLYTEAHTPYAWHGPLFAHARARGLIVFSSVFDETAVELLEGLDAPAYKIASFEAIDLPLIARTARAGKPLIVSTGMTTPAEIAAAIATARAHGTGDVALLHCVSAYPARFSDANLRMIPRLAADYGCVAGLSDHTPGTAASVAAVTLGAAVIEKHVTLARADGGPDSSFSLEPDELTRLTSDCRHAWEALGEAAYARGPEEGVNRTFRRSLYIVRDVALGTRLTAADVRSIRPGFGLEPERLAEVLGRSAMRPLKRGEPLAWDMIGDA
ncbi:pseudaminic acid synthase [Caulobacter sp. S45]|uniref:pseudaminic acid synthase n=1 Tax=Caulobacter sp. S45 TaxID=1641861 RepID=UPI00131E3355|nr:pseudaminic acid synthase [Caulobacter sp. S45]